MLNLLYFAFCSFVWGSTWMVIGYQIQGNGPLSSVFYRFILCALLFFLIARLKKISLNYDWNAHKLFIFQGLFLFSLNFVLTYLAKSLVNSGIIAMAFSTLIYFNILGSKIYLREPLENRVLLGSLVGGLGILIFFKNQLQNFQATTETQIGIAIALASAASASIGNILNSRTLKNGVSIIVSNAWSMLYGSGFTLFLTLYLREDLSIQWSQQFILSFTYLVVFATLLTFWAYLALIKNIGAAKAAYCNMVSPLIALGLSAIFEGYVWTKSNKAGIFMCLLGSYFTLSQTQIKKDPPGPFS